MLVVETVLMVVLEAKALKVVQAILPVVQRVVDLAEVVETAVALPPHTTVLLPLLVVKEDLEDLEATAVAPLEATVLPALALIT